MPSAATGPVTPFAVTAVGQVTVPVAADGSFAAPVTLKPGANAIAVMATDGQGLTASAAASATYANPVTSGSPKVTKVKDASGKVTKETVTVPVSCAAFAPATGCKVTVKLGAKGKPLAAARTVTVPVGKTVKVVLTLSGAARAKINALAAGKHLFGNLQTIYTDPAGGTLALKVRSVKLA